MAENITSWKKERYRRQKLLARRKLHKQLMKDLDTWTKNLLRAQQQVDVYKWLTNKYNKKDN